MRIWITGVGMVSPLGASAKTTMDRLVAGERAIDGLSLFDMPGARAQIAAEVRSVRIADVAPAGHAGAWSRTDAFACLAAREALADAALERTPQPGSEPVDLIVGGTTAGLFETELTLADMGRHPERAYPFRLARAQPLSATADRLCEAAGPFRRVRTICSACSSGANAILLAAAWIAAGLSERVVAGGAEGLCRLTYSGFGALAALDPHPCRPFDRTRAGLNIGEGAAFVVLESEASAKRRGRAPIAELRGWGVGAEGHHITNPEQDGKTAARVMSEALARAEITARELDYVHAHGTATPLNDVMEAAALRRCLGDETARIPVSSSKGQIGHTLGAAGAFGVAVTALAIARKVMPPTIGLTEPDPACALTLLTQAREGRIRAALCNAFGFGGTDATLVLAEPDAFPAIAEPRANVVVVTGAGTVGARGVGGSAAAAAYVAPESGTRGEPASGPIAFHAAEHLDIARARRLDRAARIATVSAASALADAGLGALGALGANAELGRDTGVVLGAAFGNVDASIAYVQRLVDKGARLVSAAEFPNMLPSSPASHVSIYLGLGGPVASSADLAATAEASIVTAAELLVAGAAARMVAGSVEETSRIIEVVLAPAHGEAMSSRRRSEGAATLLLETEAAASARGARVLARLAWWGSFRGEGYDDARSIPPPPSVVSGREAKVAVIVPREDARTLAIVQASPWSDAPCRAVHDEAGEHDGAGGFAAAAAVGAIASGALDAALVLGTAAERGYALLFVSAETG